MRPKIVSRKAFAVMGVIGHFESASENFGPLWNEYLAVHDQIEPLSAGEGHYGIYLSADHSKSIDYLAGMAVRDAAVAPDGIKLRELPAALYAVFECAFQKIGPTYGYIWGEWLQSSEYEQDTTKFGFDYFPPSTTDGDLPIQIWFPVKKTGG